MVKYFEYSKELSLATNNC